MNRCTACGCFEHVKPPALFCGYHWRRLPEPIVRDLGQPITDMFQRAQLVNDAIRHLKDNELRTFAHAV